MGFASTEQGYRLVYVQLNVSSYTELLVYRPHRDAAAQELIKRCRMMAILNIVLAPFIVVFLFMYFFFRYAEVRSHGVCAENRLQALAHLLLSLEQRGQNVCLFRPPARYIAA